MGLTGAQAERGADRGAQAERGADGVGQGLKELGSHQGKALQGASLWLCMAHKWVCDPTLLHEGAGQWLTSRWLSVQHFLKAAAWELAPSQGPLWSPALLPPATTLLFLH